MYSLRQKWAMGWGKLRRAFYVSFRREKVLGLLSRRRGACSRCGACCKLLLQCPAYEEKDGNPRCLVYDDRPGVCGLFPLDERDLRERDIVMPHRMCGFWFENGAKADPANFREAMPVRWGPSKRKSSDGSRRFLTGVWAIIWTFFHKPPPFGGPSPALQEAKHDLDRRGATAVTVSGGCMEPTLKDGQMVLVHRARGPRPGDVALLEAGGSLEVHRLVGRVWAGSETWYVHKGDGSPKVGLAKSAQVLGVVQAAPGGNPGPQAQLALLAFRLGALLFRLGLDPR
jgi:hypothetical protein